MAKNNINIIFLNGASSSGKTTLAKMIQEKSDVPYLHIGIDKLIGMMPTKMNNWEGGNAQSGFWWKISYDENGNQLAEIQVESYARKIGKLLQEMVLTMANQGHNVIIDEVCLDNNSFLQWRKILSPYNAVFVAVKANIDFLIERERNRGDRMLGSAQAQNAVIHHGKIYDLEINIDQQSMEESVGKIWEWLESK